MRFEKIGLLPRAADKTSRSRPVGPTVVSRYCGVRGYILHYFIINLPVQTGAAERRLLSKDKRIVRYNVLNNAVLPQAVRKHGKFSAREIS